MPCSNSKGRTLPRRRGCNEDCLRRVALRLCRLANDGHDNGPPCPTTTSDGRTNTAGSCSSKQTVSPCCTTSIPEEGDACGKSRETEIPSCCTVDGHNEGNDVCCELSKAATAFVYTAPGLVKKEADCPKQEIKSCSGTKKPEPGVDADGQTVTKPCCSATSQIPICNSMIRTDIEGTAKDGCCTEKDSNACDAGQSYSTTKMVPLQNGKRDIVQPDSCAKGCCGSAQDKADTKEDESSNGYASVCSSSVASPASAKPDCGEGCCDKTSKQKPGCHMGSCDDTIPKILDPTLEQHRDVILANKSDRNMACCGKSAREDSDSATEECNDPALKKSDCGSGCCDDDVPHQASGERDGTLRQQPGCGDGCCSAPENEVNTEVKIEEGCIDECCSVMTQESTGTYDEVCKEHLQTVFEQYQPLLQKGMCLCRRIIDQLGFCCCSLSRTGSTRNLPACGTHLVSRRGPKIARGSGSEYRKINPVSATDSEKGSKPALLVQEADKEMARESEHIILNVSGMTCTGCSNKLMNVLGHVPGLTNAKVTFVSGVAEFDLHHTGSLDHTISQIESETGFKLTRIVSGFHRLHVFLTPGLARQLEEKNIQGIVSVAKVRKDLYCITYDPQIIGARDLLGRDLELAPPPTDSRLKQDRKHLWQMAMSFGVSSILTIPVLVLAWSNSPVPESIKSVIMLVLGTLVQTIAIPNFYVPALRALIYSRVLEMDMLVVISISAAYVYSVVAFGLTEAGITLRQGAFFEASTLLITLVLLGRLMSALARVRAVKAVSLRSLQTDTALLTQADGAVTQVDARLLQFGDTFKIPAHTRIVTDGEVVSGESAVDESMVTGESVPIVKQVGDQVIAGTINDAGNLLVRLTRLPGQNSITDIANLVENAMGAKPRLQSLADKVASYFVSVVICIALVVFLIWIAVAVAIRHENGGGAVGTAITYMIAVLVVSCPCALGLAIPMVLVIAGGIAAKAGVIVKAADAFETGSKISDIVFDKTGTLTLPDLSVVHGQTFDSSLDSRDALSLAKALIDKNEHPVSVAVASHLAEQQLDIINLTAVTSVPGCGIRAQWQGSTVKAGNPFWLGIEARPEVSVLMAQGMSLLCVTFGDELLSIFGLKSTLREEAVSVITKLRHQDITCHIVSGDSPTAVNEIARSLNIDTDNVVSRSSPVQKQEYIRNLQASGKSVLFCGDGTNDAVAVAQANIGVQIGSTSDVTGAVADVVLLGGLEGVLTLLDLSKRAFRRVWFNFAWAAVYNVFAILLAAGAFVKFRIPPAYVGLGEIVSVAPIFVVAGSLALNR